MDFDAGHHLTITKKLAELTNSLGGSGFVQNKPHGGIIFKDNSMVFYEGDMQILPSHHNQPLHVTTYVHDVELRLVLMNLGFSLNIMLYQRSRR